MAKLQALKPPIFYESDIVYFKIASKFSWVHRRETNYKKYNISLKIRGKVFFSYCRRQAYKNSSVKSSLTGQGHGKWSPIKETEWLSGKNKSNSLY